MMHATLSLLLATSIAACPMLCKLGSIGCESDRSIAAGCCNACPSSDGANPGGDSSTPLDPSRGPGKCGHCICSGALVDKTGLESAQLDAQWSLPAPVLHATAVATGSAQFECFSTPLPPDNGTNVGRALCRLYMTFLC